MDFANWSREDLVAMLSSQPVKVKVEQAETDVTPVKLEKDSPRKASRSDSCGSTVIVLDTDSEDDSAGNGEDDNDVTTDRKRKRDPDTPRKKRPPPRLRENTSGQGPEDVSTSSPPTYSQPLMKPRQRLVNPDDDFVSDGHADDDSSESDEGAFLPSGRAEDQAGSSGSDNVDLATARRSRKAKDKAESSIRTLIKVTSASTWRNAEVPEGTANGTQTSDEGCVDEQSDSTQEETTTGETHDVMVAKLPRWIERLAPGQDTVSSVRRAFKKVADESWDRMTSPEQWVYNMSLNPKLKVFAGNHQCDWCKKQKNNTNRQRSGMQKIPCLSSGDGSPCIPCSLRRQRCSFKTGGRSTNTVASRPAGRSGTQDVLTPKPHAHRVPQTLSQIPSAQTGLQSGSKDEVTRLRRKFTRKLKSTVDFLGENLREIHPDTGPAAANLLDTLQEVRDELVERLGDTDDLLKQIRIMKK